jgi:hypothetical protein
VWVSKRGGNLTQAGATRSNRVGVLVWNSQIFRVRE